MRTLPMLHVVAQYACMTKSLNTNTQMSAWTEGEGRPCLVLYALGADRGVLGLFGRGHRPGAPELPMQVPQACAWRLPGQVAAALSWEQVLNTRTLTCLLKYLCSHSYVVISRLPSPGMGVMQTVASMTVDFLLPIHIQVTSQA